MAADSLNDINVTDTVSVNKRFLIWGSNLWTLFKENPLHFILPLFVILIFQIIGFVVWKIYSQKSRKNSKKLFSHHTTCTSPNCVRCNRYETALDEAQTLLKNYPTVVLNTDIKGNNVRQNSVQVKKTEESIERVTSALKQWPQYNPKNRQNPNVLSISNLTTQNFWTDDEHFAKVSEILESNAPMILEEFIKIPKKAQWEENNTPHGSWKVFHLINQGLVLEKNCFLVPKTMQLLESVPGLMRHNLFGNVCFSVVDAGTWITPHYGPCNTRIRCHLGLQTFPQYHLIVDGIRRRSWRNGRCLYFDDSFLHEVRYLDEHSNGHGSVSIVNNAANSNAADSLGSALVRSTQSPDEDLSIKPPRAVLILDLWHPDLTEDEIDALNYIFPSSVNSYEQWKAGKPLIHLPPV